MNSIEAVAAFLIEVHAEIIDGFISTLFLLQDFDHCLSWVGRFKYLSLEDFNKVISILRFDVRHFDAVKPFLCGHGKG